MMIFDILWYSMIICAILITYVNIHWYTDDIITNDIHWTNIKHTDDKNDDVTSWKWCMQVVSNDSEASLWDDSES